MKLLLANIFAMAITAQDAIYVVMLFVALLAFIATIGINRIIILRIRERVRKVQDISTIMQHTLDISNNYVLKLDVRKRYAINLHGNMLPEEGMSYEESFEMIHPDDRHIYRNFIARMVIEGKSTATCLFRWDMSGHKHLGNWRYMRDQGMVEYSRDKDKEPSNIFCTLTDETEKFQKNTEKDEMTDKYKMMFEQSIIGLAFYDKDGNLMNANRKMREILKFQSDDDPYYFGNSLYEVPAFQELVSHKQMEDFYFCTKSVVVERGVNCYTEMHLHPIYDENGELYYISCSMRDITQERKLDLQNKRNDQAMQRAKEEIQQYETELQYLMDTCDIRFFRTSFANKTCTFYKSLGIPEKQMSFEELTEHFVDSPFRSGLTDFENYFSEPKTDLTYMHPFFHEGEELQWNYIDSVPFFNNQGQLEGTYGIVRNVTSLIEKQEKLKLETERAKDSGRMKSVFMANMTHEIRTPLNSIVGFSDILPMLSTPEEKKEIVRVIMNNCDMLLRLINDILAISSLDEGGILIEPHQVDFAKSFDDICNSLKERIQEPGVAFIEDNPYHTLVTNIDNGRIQQVITNLMTNAIKYTHQGYIKTGYRYENDGLYIYCEDTGDGIPKEAQGKIFERFVKLNDFIQGTGLGLSICKAITDACHGQIGVISKGEGQGSTFWLWIPCEALNIEQKVISNE
ncbi:MAG: PAS domain-containing protein [Prevotella sp.]|nr:PAS domain-containing protein [Prevotella sp.]